MSRWMLSAIFALLLLTQSHTVQGAAVPSNDACAADAVQQARKLLVFHFGGEDDRMEVDTTATPLASIINPANKSQRFDVLEVWAQIYKGNYRMRFEYYRSGDTCLLMGQEILEHASL